ncbi:uncharacterized protein Tco025E_00213 [Trypanosoma conorhini]|uniref:Uncharacterized protein n=1 Tax=Trypanosoma conorhini TaxID=83891 RepID=A0A422QC47_9TRYP|nr:uncharacterized protein Tco025E_00213 [Trypanosoma conorhini]RNF27563.1 hypothetical protein Tco025E_00213 [Trypanosoma conorhini]
MQLSAAPDRAEAVAAASVCGDARFQLKPGRPGVVLKLCGSDPRRARLAGGGGGGGGGGGKRPRDCRQPGGAGDDTSRGAAASVLRGLRGAAAGPVQGVELRHAELTAIHVAPEFKDAGGQLGEANEGAITLSNVVSLKIFAGLHTLDLECNRLGDDGITRLCLWCLPQLRFLRCLFLASNEFGVPGLRAIVNYVEGKLAAVHAATPSTPSNASPAGRPQPIEAVGLTNNLLYSNKPEDEGATVLLARLLQACGKSLRRLHLNHVGMPTSAAATMMQLCFAGDTERAEGFPYPQLVIYLKQNDICKELLHSMLRTLGVSAAAGRFVV